MAHVTITKGRHSELLAQTALLANGWTVCEPIAPEPFDLIAKPPSSDDWVRIQIKSARVRDDRNGEVVVMAKKNNGQAYDSNDCDAFIGVLGNDVYLFDNRQIGEYWVPADKVAEKWTQLKIDFDNVKEASA